ncbi:Interleukin-17A [Takifugu flavidus]|uniref:Interleukin-17A n=1 Tax=Takifugu flavidus TaxID=433684 RepID=A0A5C6NKA5_9TELE|nr:Interleukin-17A [Takifugu flavidus]
MISRTRLTSRHNHVIDKPLRHPASHECRRAFRGGTGVQRGPGLRPHYCHVGQEICTSHQSSRSAKANDVKRQQNTNETGEEDKKPNLQSSPRSLTSKKCVNVSWATPKQQWVAPLVQGGPTCPGWPHLTRVTPPAQVAPPAQGGPTCPGWPHLPRVAPLNQGDPTCPGWPHLPRVAPTSHLKASPATETLFRETIGMLAVMMMVAALAAALPRPGGHLKRSVKANKKSPAVMETVPLQLDPKNLVVTHNIRPLENVSISPWTYNISRDTSLFPPLAEARCLFRGCLDSEGQEDQSLESKPIMRQVLLLRKVSSEEGAGHSYHFRLESRLVAVGCTCIRPVVLHHQ